MGLQIEAGAAAHEEGPNPELVDFTRRLWIAAILTVPLLVLTMSPFLGITAVEFVSAEGLNISPDLRTQALDAAQARIDAILPLAA